MVPGHEKIWNLSGKITILDGGVDYILVKIKAAADLSSVY